MVFLSGIFLSITNSFATPWYSQDPAIQPGVPDYTPSQESIDAGVVCGEVAAANVVSYFDSHGFPNLVPDGKTPDNLMQDLINYDVRSDPETGLKKYFKDKGYGNDKIKIKNLSPTWDNIIKELKAGELLILGFTWGGTLPRAHVVNIVGWDETPSKQLGFHDMNNPLNPNLRGNPPTNDYQYSSGNTDFYKIDVTNTGSFSFKYQETMVVNANSLTSISPVPEPSTFILFLFGLIGIVGVKKIFS